MFGKQRLVQEVFLLILLSNFKQALVKHIRCTLDNLQDPRT